jgi:hypothetical protein
MDAHNPSVKKTLHEERKILEIILTALANPKNEVLA